MKTSGIYKLQWDTGNYYIGLSLNLNTRLASHLSDMRKNKHYNSKVQACFNTNGEPKYIILEYCNIVDLKTREIAHINLEDPLILNISPGGGISFGENSARCKYLDNQIEQAFLLLIDNKLSRKEIGNITGVDLSTIYDISSGRGRGLDFIPTKYPDEFKILLNRRACNTRGKNSYTITDGISIVTLKTGEFSKFCRDNNIHSSNLSKVFHGERKETGGWKLLDENI